MATLATAKSFVQASQGNAFFAKYGGKPGGARQPSAPNGVANNNNAFKANGVSANGVTAPSANGTGAAGKPMTINGNPAAPAGTTNVNSSKPQVNGGSSSQEKDPPAVNGATHATHPSFAKVTNGEPVSAAEKMSAFTHNAKVDDVVKKHTSPAPQTNDVSKPPVSNVPKGVDEVLNNAIPQIRNHINDLTDHIMKLEASVKEASMPPTPAPGELTPPATPPATEEKKKLSLEAHLASQGANSIMPAFIARLQPYFPSLLSQKPVSLEESETFTLPFIKRHLGGEEYSPGLFYPAHSLTCKLTEDEAQRNERLRRAWSRSAKVKGRVEKETWNLFDKSTNPFVPSKPGAHGAALTPMFRDNDEGTDEQIVQRYCDVPLFVCVDDGEGATDGADNVSPKAKDFGREKRYVYMGQYTQSRWSDKLSVSEIGSVVPTHVLAHWSRILSTPSRRPAWMSEALLELLEIKPDLEINAKMTDAALLTHAKDYLEQLELWREDAERALSELTEAKVMKWFRAPDAGDRAGLRLWWEYLECISYDRSFYQTLATLKRKEEHLVSEGQRGPNPDAPLPAVFGQGVNPSCSTEPKPSVFGQGVNPSCSGEEVPGVRKVGQGVNPSCSGEDVPGLRQLGQGVNPSCSGEDIPGMRKVGQGVNPSCSGEEVPGLRKVGQGVNPSCSGEEIPGLRKAGQGVNPSCGIDDFDGASGLKTNGSVGAGKTVPNFPAPEDTDSDAGGW